MDRNLKVDYALAMGKIYALKLKYTALYEVAKRAHPDGSVAMLIYHDVIESINEEFPELEVHAKSALAEVDSNEETDKSDYSVLDLHDPELRWQQDS